MSEISKEIRQQLFALQDVQYRDFQSRLIPTVAKETVIGVRTPELRNLAKKLAAKKEIEEFLNDLPHKYYEENNLHGFLIMQELDYIRCIEKVEAFLPYIDNWATCDLLRPKVFQKNRSELIRKIPDWLESGHPYTIRFGIEMLMVHYLDEAFSPEYPKWVAGLRRQEEYYVKMMIAWYFATALAMQYESTIPYIENHALDIWTHNKTIQKAVESYQISEARKAYLKTLRIRRALP